MRAHSCFANLQPLGLEFFRGIDAACHFSPHFAARLNLRCILCIQSLGTWQSEQDRTHTGAVV